MSLPSAWIDRIFDRLILTYGRDFLGRWEGIDVDAVKDDWAEKLAGFEHRGGSALAYALDNLPERPPTVIEFARIARGGPFLTPDALPHEASKPRGPNDAEREMLRKLAEDIRKGEFFAKPSRRWAYDLVKCHEQGWRHGQRWKSTPAALAMAREAIAIDQRLGGRDAVDDWGAE